MDTATMDVVERAVREAFAACEAEEIVVLQLIHLHGITQRELAALLHCHESRLSRLIKSAEQKIARATLAAVEKFDPLLEVTWDDFLRLCESTNLLRTT